MAAAAKLVKSPEAVPEGYKGDVAKLEEPLRRTFNLFTIPYSIQVKFAQKDWTTYADLACIWDTAVEARAQCSADLEFERDGDYDNTTKRTIAMRMFQAVTRAKQDYAAMGTRSAPTLGAPSGGDQAMVGLAKRKMGEAAYKRITGKDPPPLNKQGSHKFLLRQ